MTDTNYRGRQTELDYWGDSANGAPTKGVWNSKDRQQFRRHPLTASSILIANSKRCSCVIEDITAGGLRATVDAELPVHTLVKIEDKLAGVLKGKVPRAGAGSAVIKIGSDKGSSTYILDLICGQQPP